MHPKIRIFSFADKKINAQQKWKLQSTTHSILLPAHMPRACPLWRAFPKKENKTSRNMVVTPKKTYQFPRNQCIIACNGIIHDRDHPLLLFGSS